MSSDNIEYSQKVELAYLALMKGETDEALELCQQAARLEPLGLGHLYLLGLVSMSLKDLGRGIKFLEEGVNIALIDIPTLGKLPKTKGSNMLFIHLPRKVDLFAPKV